MSISKLFSPMPQSCVAILTCSARANVITCEVDGSFTSRSGTPLVNDGQPWSLSFQIDTTQGQIDFPGQLSFPNTVVHVSVPDLAGTNTGSHLTTVQFSPPGGGMLPPFPELGFNGSLSPWGHRRLALSSKPSSRRSLHQQFGTPTQGIHNSHSAIFM
jgi:hypothetical protein